jgi:hypothetical protein
MGVAQELFKRKSEVGKKYIENLAIAVEVSQVNVKST